VSDLPKSYVRVARQITGYWGTYLPTLNLQLGTIGRRSDGIFVREGHLSHYPGYSAKRFKLDDHRPNEPTVVWNTQSVRMERLKAEANALGEVATAGVRLNFGAANEAAIICNAPREQSFADLLEIKDFMWQLRRSESWDDELCVVTDLVWVESAWICFSTASGQTADIKAKVPVTIPGDPTTVLSALSGSASVEASHIGTKSSAFCATLPSGGTPLFRAIRFNIRWLGLLKPELALVKGPDEAFEEASFGDSKTDP
jgi:hypothetical protein